MSANSPISLSAVVPSHGHRSFLPARFASIVGQTRPPDELIVIDDASRDGSADWLRAWRSPLPLRLECRRSALGSPGAVWNAGVARAQGDWLWIAESDDDSHPDFLATLLAAATRHPDAAIIQCQSELIDRDGHALGSFLDYTREYDTETWREDFVLAGREAIARLLLPRNAIPNVSACLLSRRAWLAAGGAATELSLCSDWLTYGRLLAHGPLVFCAATLNRHRHHAATQRARTSASEYVRQSYAARTAVAALHGLTGPACEFARRYAWHEAAGQFRVPPEQLPETLSPAARAAALEFDPDFVPRAHARTRQAWDRCEIFLGADGGFSAARRRCQPIQNYDTWTTLRFRRCTAPLRIDPASHAGRAAVRRLTLSVPETGTVLVDLTGAECRTALVPGAGVQWRTDGDELWIECAHDDPQLFLSAVATGDAPFDLAIELLRPLP